MDTNPLDLAAGAVPPVPDGGGLALGLQVTLGKVASATERVAAVLDQAAKIRAQLPVAIPITAVGTVPNPAAAFMIDLGGPVAGRQWTIRRWTVADGADVTNTIAGGSKRADLYIGRPFGAGSTAGALSQWADTMGSPPGVQHISQGELIVTPTDRVFIIISGATTVGQQIAVCVMVHDEPQASYSTVMEA